MTLAEMASLAEQRDAQIMDRNHADKLRRERDRALARVEVLELEVRQLQHELDCRDGGISRTRW